MLEFDAYQRSETVRRIISELLPNTGSTILDVGGYPGRLRALMPQYQWVICDPLVDAPGDQVVGDASALPFQNNALNASVSLDVLEHIKPDCRPAFIQEIHRVSKQGFILSFPYDHPLVKDAEKHVRTMYEEKYSGKKHPWLEEHHVYGLPNADEIKSLCQQLGSHVTTLHVGKVDRWQMLQQFGLLLEGSPEGIEAVKKIDGYYQSNVFQNDFHAPSYRVVIICWKENVSNPIGQLFPKLHDDKQIDLALQSCLLTQCSTIMNSKLNLDSETNSDLSGHQINEYIKRMETGLRLWEDTCAKLNQRLLEELQWRDKIESNILMKLFKKMKRLFRQ